MTPKTTSLHKAPLPPPLATCRPAPSVFLHCFAFSLLLFIFFHRDLIHSCISSPVVNTVKHRTKNPFLGVSKKKKKKFAQQQVCVQPSVDGAESVPLGCTQRPWGGVSDMILIGPYCQDEWRWNGSRAEVTAQSLARRATTHITTVPQQASGNMTEIRPVQPSGRVPFCCRHSVTQPAGTSLTEALSSSVLWAD